MPEETDLTGREFQFIRERAGFSRGKFVQFLASKPAWLRGRIGTVAGLEDLETDRGAASVADCYITALRELVGVDAFRKHYKRIEEMRARRKTSE